MFKARKATFLLTVAGVAITGLMVFQNCSPAQFSPDPNALVLRTAGAEDSSSNDVPNDGIPDPGGTPIPGGTPTSSPTPALTPTPAASPSPGASPTPSASPTPQSSPSPGVSPTPQSSPQPEGPGDQGDGNIVECQMLHPNRKIVLGPELEVQPSNASLTRVCMSSHACLDLINEYAVTHKCSLNPGKDTSAANAQLQCTEIFPGTQGTCHNATIMSDEEVSNMLKHLGSK